jgi:hypothetical protein
MLFILFALSIGAQAGAQQGSQFLLPNNKVEMFTKHMQHKFNLTDSQTSEVLHINQQFSEKIKPIITSDKDKMVKLQAVKVIANEREKALSKVFTSQQMQVFIANKKERQALVAAWLKE